MKKEDLSWETVSVPCKQMKGMQPTFAEKMDNPQGWHSEKSYFKIVIELIEMDVEILVNFL